MQSAPKINRTVATLFRMNIQEKIADSSIGKAIIGKAKNTSLPGFDDESIYEVVRFFIAEIKKGYLVIQAKSVAFTFFLALFPYIIFMFTLIPYIPIDNIQQHILMVLRDFLPLDVYHLLEATIEDIVIKKKGSLLSIGLFLAIMLSTNGMMGVMDCFDRAAGVTERRKSYMQRIVAFQLTVIVFILLILSLVLIVAGNVLLKLVLDEFHILNGFNFIFFSTIKWMALLILFFSAISAIYYFGPSYKQKWSMTSAGSTLATFLIVVFSIGFSYFVNNFGRYNEIYGSLGTVVAMQMFIYLNSFALLIGFELNVSIKNAKENTVETAIHQSV